MYFNQKLELFIFSLLHSSNNTIFKLVNGHDLLLTFLTAFLYKCKLCIFLFIEIIIIIFTYLVCLKSNVITHVKKIN